MRRLARDAGKGGRRPKRKEVWVGFLPVGAEILAQKRFVQRSVIATKRFFSRSEAVLIGYISGNFKGLWAKLDLTQDDLAKKQVKNFNAR